MVLNDLLRWQYSTIDLSQHLYFVMITQSQEVEEWLGRLRCGDRKNFKTIVMVLCQEN